MKDPSIYTKPFCLEPRSTCMPLSFIYGFSKLLHNKKDKKQWHKANSCSTLYTTCIYYFSSHGFFTTINIIDWLSIDYFLLIWEISFLCFSFLKLLLAIIVFFRGFKNRIRSSSCNKSKLFLSQYKNLVIVFSWRYVFLECLFFFPCVLPSTL